MSKVSPFLFLWLFFSQCSISPTPFEHWSKNGEVEIFEPEHLSTDIYHESISWINPAGNLIYLSRCSTSFNYCEIALSKLENDQWSPPQTLAFSNSGYDIGSSFSPGNRALFFTSKRPTKDSLIHDEWNIWQVNRNGESGWDNPVLVPSPINSNFSECCLTMNKNGQAFFSSDRHGSWDIYEATYKDGIFSDIKPLAHPINTEDTGEWPAYISEDGTLLLFSSIRDEGHGGDDIYYAQKIEHQWQTPINLGPNVNTKSYEDSPLIYKDKYLFFSSWKETDFSKSKSNIYLKKLDHVLDF